MFTSRTLLLVVPVFLCGCANGLAPAALQETCNHSALEGTPNRDELHDAVRSGDVIRVRQQLALHPDRLDETERFTKRPLTPLQIAAERNQLAVMRVLIERGANLNGDSWCAPLQLAAHAGHRDAAELLLAHGALLDLYSAVALDKRDEVERYLQVAGLVGMANWLANSRFMGPDWESHPLLHVAESRGHLEMARLLLRYGADPTAKVITIPCFISDINLKGVTVGLTPAGTFAPDLDVPVGKP